MEVSLTGMQKLWLDQIKCHISQVKVRLCCRNQPWALSFLCNGQHGSKSSPFLLYRHGHLTFTFAIRREKIAGGSQRVVLVAFAPLPPLLSPAPFPPFLPFFLLSFFSISFSSFPEPQVSLITSVHILCAKTQLRDPT